MAQTFDCVYKVSVTRFADQGAPGSSPRVVSTEGQTNKQQQKNLGNIDGFAIYSILKN